MQGSLAGYKFKYIVPVPQTRSGHPDKVRGAVVDGHTTSRSWSTYAWVDAVRIPVVCTKWGNGERFRLIHADGRTRHLASFTRVLVHPPPRAPSRLWTVSMPVSYEKRAFLKNIPESTGRTGSTCTCPDGIERGRVGHRPWYYTMW